MLTPRQKVIQRLVCRGSDCRRVAEHLGISQRTVEVHRANLARRLAAESDKDPLDHPAVRRVLVRLSNQVAALATELEQIQGAR